LIGIGAMAAGVFGVGLARSPGHLLGAFLLMAIGWSTMSLTAVTALVAPWFERRRGLALSLALNGASCGGIVLAPALIWLSDAYGLQRALGIAVTTMLLILVPLIGWCTGRRPIDLGLAPDGAAPSGDSTGTTGVASSGRRRVVADPQFWPIALPFALGLLAQVGFLTHLVAVLTPVLGTSGAATALALTTAAAVVGRLGLGLVVDRFEPRRTTAACLVSQALAVATIALWPDPIWLYVACGLFGLSVGNLITLPAVVAHRTFPASDFLPVVASIAAISQIFYAFGPGLLGVLRDLGDSYTLPLALCAGLELLAAVILVLPVLRRSRRTAVTGIR
jgi:MFS family permease